MTALLLVTMQSFAQTSLDALYGMFDSGAVSISCSYEMAVQQTKVVGNSDLYVQGKMYRMDGNGLAVYCDGLSVWVVDESSKEVVIEPVSDTPEEYMNNPVLLLADIDGFFNVQSQKTDKGRTRCVLVAVKDCGVDQVFLNLDEKGLIHDAVFSLSDGSELDVNVSSMKKAEEKPSSFFSPQLDFGPDWIVTDLR